MTPAELYRTYRNLSVDLANGITVSGLDVHKYRINTNSSGPTGTGGGLAAYGKLEAQLKKAGKPSGGGYLLDETDESKFCPLFRKIERINFQDLWRAYVGKGSPETIRQALRVAVFLRLVKGEKAALQRYCDDNIGLDCSGFAGNFYGGKWVDKGANYFRDYGIEVPNLADIRANDAICWTTTNHIALVDRVYPANKCTTAGDPILQSMVAESTAAQMVPNGPSNGLAYTEYYFLSGNGASDVVARGPVLHLKRWNVKVVRIT